MVVFRALVIRFSTVMIVAGAVVIVTSHALIVLSDGMRGVGLVSGI